jgi:hypothetical protein
MHINEQIIAELRSFVETIAENQPTPAKKFIYELLFGMIASGSVLLTEIGRKLTASATLHAIEKRLSRQLGSSRWTASELQKRYVERVASQITAETVLALDISDIRKTYATKMECLGRVRDGSRAEFGRGYWLSSVEAHQLNGERQGIYFQAWSAWAEDFESETREMQSRR